MTIPIEKIDFALAQEFCNFVVFKPSYLPKESKIFNQTLRPESSETIATYHCVIQGLDFEFSIKQFNFSDIESIPAYDHPNLWKCPSVVSRRKELDALFKIDSYVFGGNNASIANNIIWIGSNYKEQPQKSLTAQIMRTSIEITVRSGQISDEELLKVCRGLQPSNSALSERINSTTFAELCHKYRYPKKAGNVPISYWKYQRPESFDVNMFPAHKIPENMLAASTCPTQIGEYKLNSAIQFSENSITKEVEYIYEHNQSLGSYIRLLISQNNKDGSIVVPPEPSDQNCHMREFKYNQTLIYHTYLSPDYGMHGAAWTNHKFNIYLFAKPTLWTNITWFEKLTNQMVEYYQNTNEKTSSNCIVGSFLGSSRGL